MEQRQLYTAHAGEYQVFKAIAQPETIGVPEHFLDPELGSVPIGAHAQERISLRGDELLHIIRSGGSDVLVEMINNPHEKSRKSEVLENSQVIRIPLSELIPVSVRS